MDFNNLDQDWCFASTEVMAGFADLLKRVMALEQQVANQALAMKKIGELNMALQTDVALKSQAAQQQAQGNSNLYAPLRSDTKPLIEMAAFVRKIAERDLGEALTSTESALIREAREILKRST